MAVVIGGCTTDWDDYDFADLRGLLATIRAAPIPTLGICAGHQLIGYAHGAEWGPLGPLQPGEVDPDPRFVPGQRKERGFLPVEIDASCPLFDDLGVAAVFFQSHYWQLLDVPEGFVARALSSWSPIQAIERLDRPVFGVQFHPERFSRSRDAGARVVRRFLDVAAAHQSGPERGFAPFRSRTTRRVAT
ncbi:MAG: gamma-glutamyl-gamma-aminobutyrate hydrolase family protein [Chloroflexia bacterium]|nr:gamma-glutamyl-gamma-aminobutyrate hydrolase family protein [Chloroflexia bacterium]